MYTNYHHHGLSTHKSAPSTNSEGLIILAATFGSILIFITAYLLAQCFIRSFPGDDSDHEMNTDLEVFRSLLARDSPKTYRTFPSMSHEAFTQDPEIRRMMRDERLRDNVAGIYRISAQRSRGGGSVSSASSDSESEDEHRDPPREQKEEEEESSESEDESASSSDSDEEYRGEVAYPQELMDLRRPALPKRVALLRGFKS